MKTRLSVVIITLNAAETIRECLESVKCAEELIVVDSGSTDGTLEICREFGVKIFDHAFVGYGPQKNFGLDQASGDWIFVIDADESVTAALASEIVSAIEGTDACDGYRVARKNYFGDRWIRFGGWYPDYSVRLIRRGRGRFNDRAVHEAMQVEGEVGTLRESMIHRTCRDFEEFERRQMRYAELAARQMAQQGSRASAMDILMRPPTTFLKMFVLKGGFLEGAKGWRLAWLYARYTRKKYRLLSSLTHKG